MPTPYRERRRGGYPTKLGPTKRVSEQVRGIGSYAITIPNAAASTIPTLSSAISLMCKRGQVVDNVRARRAHRVQISPRPAYHGSTRRVHIHSRRRKVTTLRRQRHLVSNLLRAIVSITRQLTQPIVRKGLLTIQRHLHPITFRYKTRHVKTVVP